LRIMIITFLTSILTILIIIAFYPLLLQSILSLKGMKNTYRVDVSEREKRCGRIFILVPIKRESEDVIESFLKSMMQINSSISYNLIFIIDEDEPKKLLEVMRRVNFQGDVKILHRPKAKGYKGGALNYALSNLELKDSDIIIVLDIDSIITSEFLHKIVESDFNVLVPKWVVKNEDTVLARGQKLGYEYFFKFLKGLYKYTGWIPTLGSGLCIKYSTLKLVNGFPETILEDVELGVRLLINNVDIKYCEDIYILLEAPSNYYSFTLQQCRWAYGTISIVRRYFKYFLKSWRNFIVLLYLCQYLAYMTIIPIIIIMYIFCVMDINLNYLTLLIITSFSIFAVTLYILSMYSTLGKLCLKDLMSINSINMAYILAIPRMSWSLLLGLSGWSFKWIPTPKGARKYSHGVIIEVIYFFIVLTLQILSIVKMLLTITLLTLPLTLCLGRGLYRLLHGTL